jgi:hypothetical protein
MTAHDTQNETNQWLASVDQLRLIARQTFHLIELTLHFRDSLERQSALDLHQNGNSVAIEKYRYWTNRLLRDSRKPCRSCDKLLRACANRLGEHLDFLDEYQAAIRARDTNKIWELKNAVTGSESAVSAGTSLKLTNPRTEMKRHQVGAGLRKLRRRLP